jgi:hypothetical protein
MHEIMHRLGFDHEHSRFDRNENVEIITENIKGAYYNFEKNSGMSKWNINWHSLTYFKIVNFKLNFEETKDDQSPYDFFSITHYNSTAHSHLPNEKNKSTILTKIPSLVSKNGVFNIEREMLSKIDIIQIQKLFKCNQLEMPSISKAANQYDIQKIKEISER